MLATTSLKSASPHLHETSVTDYESGDEYPWDTDYQSLDTTLRNDTVFHYEKLGHATSQIRTLTLAPASDKRSDIHCRLETASFGYGTGNQAVYEALSYTWGDPTQKRVIYVDGRPLLVTRNLDIALRYLRKPFEPRVLWVDAVCIDQCNLQEKAQQVMMMKDIYREASCVLVWLGESDNDIRKAMDQLKRLEAPGYIEPSLVNSFYEPFEAGLNKIFRKSWWSSLWVIQEVILAEHPPLVGCGRKWLSWKAFQKAMMNLALAKTDRDNFLENLSAILNFGIMPTPYSTHDETQRAWWRRLENVLNATCDRDATEPHDKIFALLGLIDGSISDSLIPDYGQPCSIIYQIAMVYVLEAASNLDFLVKAMKQKRFDVPSWCIDFSKSNWNQHAYGQGWPIFLKNDHSASGNLLKSKISHNLDDGTLTVAGSVLGRIEHVVVSELSPTGSARFTNVLRDMVRFTIAAEPALRARFGETTVLQMLATGDVWKTTMNPGDLLYTNSESLNET
ncbi:MAG: hypothetical protein Q9218_006675 [Villophora microphyllina]